MSNSNVLPPLGRGDKGAPVVELQMRLAGFRGTIPDGNFGPGTELQVLTFQSIYMGESQPSGIADTPTMEAISEFGAAHPIDFNQLRCPCKQCGGFGQKRFANLYRSAGNLEVYHRYEYPGLHRMLLWTYRAARIHAASKGWKLTINSGYRCAIDNANHQRSSTNHHGKAIDIDILPAAGTDRERCNGVRGLLVERANAQVGWAGRNRKSLEPANIAPTWVHLDVRSYDRTYLQDRYFVKNNADLNIIPA